MSCKCTNYSEPLATFSDVKQRCEHYEDLRATLDTVVDDLRAWRSVLRCRVCGALWAQEYPFSEMHGGGPACFYRITTADPAQWLVTAPDLTMQLRREHEDRSFFACLGEEIGPELCRHSGCTHKRIQFSVMCRLHHFEMITKRPYPYATNEA